MSEIAALRAARFSAADLRRRMAEREAAKAAEEMRHMKEQEEKQKAVMEEFHKPPARTPDQLMRTRHAARRPGCRARTERGPDLPLSKFPV